MCIITKKLQPFEIREKRNAIRKKIQSEIHSPIGKMFVLGANNLE